MICQSNSMLPSWVRLTATARCISSTLLEQGIDVRVWRWGWHSFSTESKVLPRSSLSRRAFFGTLLMMTRSGSQVLRQYFRRQTRADTQNAEPRAVLPASITGGAWSDLDLIQTYSRSKIDLGFLPAATPTKLENVFFSFA